MTLDELINLLLNSADCPPSICADSRLVQNGDIFVAVPGTTLDGHDFIDNAIQKGAEYVVCERPINSNNAEIIVVHNSAQALGLLAQASHGNPSSKLTNLAVTGTNGKTTVGFLVRSVISHGGQKCGLVGTIVYDTGSQTSDANMTTPEAIAVAQLAQKMVRSGVKYMMIEASSHALSQNRLAGINFTAAAFTNLTGDHLDYHKNMDDYLAAKMVLFEELSPCATAVLNKQSPVSQKIAKATKAKIIWYGIDTEADITAHIKSMDISSTILTLRYNKQTQEMRTRLIGRHNVSNILAAAGLCLAAKFDLKTIAEGLATLQNVPGRLEAVDCDRARRAAIAVLIDYAHTDDALKNVLTTLRPLCKNRLVLVFGCGGDRDKTKRPRMAKVAEQFADSILVTSDNPRTEKPQAIINDIITGFENPASPRIKIEPDRKKAIQLAIESAQKDDIVLIAGKGHETYQIVGKTKFDFNDKAVALKFLQERK